MAVLVALAGGRGGRNTDQAHVEDAFWAALDARGINDLRVNCTRPVIVGERADYSCSVSGEKIEPLVARDFSAVESTASCSPRGRCTYTLILPETAIYNLFLILARIPREPINGSFIVHDYVDPASP